VGFYEQLNVFSAEVSLTVIINMTTQYFDTLAENRNAK